MKVKELIEKLKKMPQDEEVWLEACDEDPEGWSTCINFSTADKVKYEVEDGEYENDDGTTEPYYHSRVIISGDNPYLNKEDY